MCMCERENGLVATLGEHRAAVNRLAVAHVQICVFVCVEVGV